MLTTDQVRPADGQERTLTVPFAEDPKGRAKKVAHMWAIRHRVDAGFQDAEGRVRRVNPMVIRVGDFVDVALTVHAVSLRLPRNRRAVEVMFAPQAIVRLVSSTEATVCELRLYPKPELKLE